MGIVDDAVNAGTQFLAYMKSGVTALYCSVTQKKSSSQKMKLGSKLAILLVVILGLPLALLLLVFELSSEPNDRFSTLMSTSTLLQTVGGFAGPRAVLIRFPNERLPRRVQPGSFLSSQFLHESNLNTTTIDLNHGEVRPFQPHGVGTHLYMHLGTYRSSPRAFSTAGSIDRGIVDWMHPEFTCTWRDANGTEVGSKEVQLNRPGVEFHGVYDSMIIICHFEHDVGVHRGGGELWITYSTRLVPYDTEHKAPINNFRTPEGFLAFTEAPGDYNATAFEPPFAYDVVYCGSPIFGDVSSQRVREWLAHHTYVFGDRSHIILHDAGGFNADVMKVVQPWVDLGRVTVENIRQMQMYEGYQRHQHTVLNDCLFKSQYMANWTFFFDIDEYLVVDPIHNLTNLLAEKAAQGITTMKFDQKHMSTTLCALQEGVDNATRDAVNSKLWASEKFIFNMHWRGEPQAHKYAVQGRYVWVTEVHNTVSLKQGDNRHLRYHEHIWFHHFHGFVIEHGEGCRDFTDAARATWDAPFNYGNENYSADFTLANLIDEVKKYELAHVGVLPFIP